jgi:hypothetical protein
MKVPGMLRTLLTALALLGAPAAALAQEAPAPAPAEPEKPKDPIVCKRTQQSHTRIGSQRICLPQSQWDIQTRELQEMQRRNNQLRPNAQG